MQLRFRSGQITRDDANLLHTRRLNQLSLEERESFKDAINFLPIHKSESEINEHNLIENPNPKYILQEYTY